MKRPAARNTKLLFSLLSNREKAEESDSERERDKAADPSVALIIGAANLCIPAACKRHPPLLHRAHRRVQTEESASLQMSQVFCQMPLETCTSDVHKC